MPTPSEILTDPNFHALPIQERLKVLRTVDPNFAALPTKDQGTVIYQSQSKLHPVPDVSERDKEPSEGFGASLFHMPLRGIERAAKGAVQLGQEGQRKEGFHNVVTGAGMAAAPFLLPEALIAAPGATALTMGAGAIGGGGGYGAARLAGANEDTAEAIGDVAGLAAGAATAIPTVSAFGRGAAKAAAGQVRPLLTGLNPLEHPLKILPDLVDAGKAVTRGGKKGVADLRASQRIGSPTNPQWKDVAPPPGDLAPVPIGPTGKPILNARSKSSPPPTPGSGRVPVWTGPDPPPGVPMEATSIPSDLPSGRKVGPLASKTAKGRDPIWKGAPDPPPSAQPDPENLGAPQLPSGRTPGKPAFDTTTGEVVGGGSTLQKDFTQTPPKTPKTSTTAPRPTQQTGRPIFDKQAEEAVDFVNRTRLDKEEFMVNYLRSRGINRESFANAPMEAKNALIDEINAYRRTISNPTEVAAEPSLKAGKLSQYKKYKADKDSMESIERTLESPLWNAPLQWRPVPPPPVR